jgi:hypothetical protein
MKINNKTLGHLLSATSREQHINGKAQKQVNGCVLRLNEGILSTTSIVKDGKTSLSRFSFKCDAEGDESIPVPDIDRLAGVLKFHGESVDLSYDSTNDKVRVKSKNKQTTLIGGFGAKAFPNSQNTLKEWEAEGIERAKQIESGGVYKLRDGTTRSPFFTASIGATELYDALKCDGINGQKLNRYCFEFDGSNLKLNVGDYFKGMTESTLVKNYAGDAFEAVFEGGLEHCVKHYTGDVKLYFLDFTEEGQGIRMIMSFSNDDWIFQAGVL